MLYLKLIPSSKICSKLRIIVNLILYMDYLKRSLKKLNIKNDYEEVDTKLASGWYVDSLEGHKKKKYKTKQVEFKISKKSNN